MPIGLMKGQHSNFSYFQADYRIKLDKVAGVDPGEGGGGGGGGRGGGGWVWLNPRFFPVHDCIV